MRIRPLFLLLALAFGGSVWGLFWSAMVIVCCDPSPMRDYAIDGLRLSVELLWVSSAIGAALVYRDEEWQS